MRTAMTIGKQQDILDGLISRNRKQIRHIEGQKDPVKRRMTRVGIAGSLVWLGALVGLLVFRRR